MPHDAALPGFDRARILDAAARARARHKRRRAIALYRRVLALEPHNAELHAKLAPLLAETNQPFDAWQSFRAVARASMRLGQFEKALAVFQEAARYLPREVEAWWSIARLERKAGRDAAAVDALLEGSRRFRPQMLRPQAIYLLRRAREVDPWHHDVVIELAQHLAATEQRDEARMLLDGLAERCEGHRLPRVREAQLRVTPGLRALWCWLEACWNARRARVAPPARAAEAAAASPSPRPAAPSSPPARPVPSPGAGVVPIRPHVARG
jgi:tetratricopeptide (TPR) repeat protein